MITKFSTLLKFHQIQNKIGKRHTPRRRAYTHSYFLIEICCGCYFLHVHSFYVVSPCFCIFVVLFLHACLFKQGALSSFRLYIYLIFTGFSLSLFWVCSTALAYVFWFIHLHVLDFVSVLDLFSSASHLVLFFWLWLF